MEPSQPTEKESLKDAQSSMNIVKVQAEVVPTILISEVERALDQIKNNKAPGEDQIVNEMIRAGGEAAQKKIKELFNKVIQTETNSGKMPSSHWFF